MTRQPRQTRFRRRCRRTQLASNTNAGFTLVELLIVVSIIAILAALLLPSMSRALGDAYRTACLNNLKSLGLAFQAYADNNNNWLPSLNEQGNGANFKWYTNQLISDGYLDKPTWDSEAWGRISKGTWRCPAVTNDIILYGGGYGVAIRTTVPATAENPPTHTFGVEWGRHTRLSTFKRTSRIWLIGDSEDYSKKTYYYVHCPKCVTWGSASWVTQATTRHGQTGGDVCYFDGHAGGYDFTYLQYTIDDYFAHASR